MTSPYSARRYNAGRNNSQDVNFQTRYQYDALQLDPHKTRMPMQRLVRSVILLAMLGLSLASQHAVAENPRVNITTSFGGIQIELLEEMAPLTVAHFLQLVDSGFYDGLVFHRVIENFMIQGGGYTTEYKYVTVGNRVKNESANGLRNLPGTVAMARLSDPDSADSQFFLNVAENPHLDATPGNPGYTVFGQIVGGAEVVEQIELVNTHLKAGMAAVPEEPVVIISIQRI
jgi:peptidyl-prolyl cis-trans isomerase A (cyclophilin A)